jgi:hypothetical protein
MMNKIENALDCLYGTTARWRHVGEDCYVLQCGNCLHMMRIVDMDDQIRRKEKCKNCKVVNFMWPKHQWGSTKK